jgi:ATP-dependent Clp endopeptidase proteolytic subunit ClpP
MSDDKKTCNVVPTLASQHYFLLNKDIEASSCGEAMTFILERNFMKKDKPSEIKLIINSQGGDMTSAFALTDVIEASSIPVWTYGLGSLCSAALTIFIAGHKGKRFITNNTSILSHQFSWGMGGKEHELIASVKEIDLTKRRVFDHYKKHTKQSETNIKKYLLPAEDCWLSAKEAVRYGLADVIMKSL